MNKSLTLVSLLIGSNLIADIDLKEDIQIRLGAQTHESKSDLSLGGRLHIEGRSYIDGLSGGVSFATTNALFGKNDSLGVGFFGSDFQSYSLLQEVYLKYNISNTTLNIGRQILDTPFADSDDRGMIANSFEAYSLTNTDLVDTTLSFSYITKMSGVDSETPEHFSKLNENRGVLAFGASYEGFSNLILNSWFYNMPSTANYSYADMEYNGKSENIEYALALQYALQDHKNSDDATIYGVGLSLGYEGATLSFAYNKSLDAVADNGFGGGPFFTSMEHLTLSEAGVDGQIFSYGLEFELVDGLGFYIFNALLESSSGENADELDTVLSYSYNDNLSLDLIYSKVDDDINGDSFNNSRFFANYSF